GRPAPAEGDGQRSGRGVAAADGDARGEGDLQGACLDDRDGQRGTEDRPGPEAVPGPRGVEGALRGGVVRAGVQRDAFRLADVESGGVTRGFRRRSASSRAGNEAPPAAEGLPSRCERRGKAKARKKPDSAWPPPRVAPNHEKIKKIPASQRTLRNWVRSGKGPLASSGAFGFVRRGWLRSAREASGRGH